MLTNVSLEVDKPCFCQTQLLLQPGQSLIVAVACVRKIFPLSVKQPLQSFNFLSEVGAYFSCSEATTTHAGCMLWAHTDYALEFVYSGDNKQYFGSLRTKI